MKYNNFHYAMSLANTLYDLDLIPEDFEEIGLVAFNLIGNKRMRLYRVCLNIDQETNTVQLPSNCDQIELLTYGFEDWNYVSNKYSNGDYMSRFTEAYIESRKHFNSPLYKSGKYVKYVRQGDILYLEEPYSDKLYLIYKGEILDEDGLPEITDKEAIAISTFCAYMSKYKEGLSTNNKALVEFAQMLERKWYKQCDAARVDDYISQNDMDQILDAKSSWNRKVYGKSYKPIR